MNNTVAGQQSHPVDFLCPDYQPTFSSRQCRNYRAHSRGCRRPDRLVCIEWTRRNMHLVVANEYRPELPSLVRDAIRDPRLLQPSPSDIFGHPNPAYDLVDFPTRKPPQTVSPPSPPVDRDLFGNPVPKPNPQKRAQPKATPPCAASLAWQKAENASSVASNPIPGFSPNEIVRFRKRSIEVCIESEKLGDVWIVPAHTQAQRTEIMPEDLATIARVLDTFPGSELISVARPTNASSPDSADCASAPLPHAERPEPQLPF